jgi:hypothetical protein
MSIAENIPTRAAAQIGAPTATAGTRTAFTSLRTSTVMMVDDDPLMLEVVRTYPRSRLRDCTTSSRKRRWDCSCSIVRTSCCWI